MKSLIFVVAFFGLAACALDSTESRFGEGGPFTVQTSTGPVSYRSTNEYVVQKVNAVVKNAQSLNAFIPNTTALGWDEFHGTQIEYLGAAGVTYLWYPGNTLALRGQWRVEDIKGGGTAICFRYGPNSYNPVTGSYGDQWECSPAWPSVFLKRAVVQGDIFRLSSGKVPFVLPGSVLPVMEMERVLARAGMPAAYVNKADWGAQMRAEQAGAGRAGAGQ